LKMTKKVFFDDITKGYNLKDEIKESAQKAVDENTRIQSLVLLNNAKIEKDEMTPDRIDFAVDNMTFKEFATFISQVF